MRTIRVWPAIAACMIACGPASGQGPSAAAAPGGACLPLDRSTAIALASDPRIGRADALERKGEADLKVATGGFYPQLSAFSRLGAGDGSLADNELDNRVGLRLSQQVFDFGETALARRAARARRDQASFAAGGTRLDVAAEVVQRHLAILRAEERADAAAIIGGYYARDAEQSSEELAAGLLRKSEAAAIRSEAAAAAAARAQEQLIARQERTALGTLVGQDVACVDAGSTEPFLARHLSPDLSAALALALANAPELKAGEAELAAAELEARREKASHRPAISVSGTVAYDYGFDGTAPRRFNRIGVDVSSPIFQGGQLRGRTQSRGAEADAARFALTAQRRELIEAVTLAWTRLDALAGILVLQETTHASALEQADALQTEFENQLVTLTDLIEARRTEYRARLDVIETRFQLDLERLRLARLTGSLVN